jgi:hypothetical protein
MLEFGKDDFIGVEKDFFVDFICVGKDFFFFPLQGSQIVPLNFSNTPQLLQK